MARKIPPMTEAPFYPVRKDPQERFDTLIKAAVDGGATLTRELNAAFIPLVNGIAEDVESAEAATAAAKEEAKAKAGEAAASARAAAGSAAAATASRDAAKTSETNAKTSETAAKGSETKARASETAAKKSETEAAASAATATEKAKEAGESAGSASESAAAALSSKGAAKTSETNAKTSETAAKSSETKAKDSETAAARSETNAKTSETNAKTSETNAAVSENAARASETSAASSKTSAEASAQTATAKASEAGTSADKAAQSEQAAKASQDAAQASEDAAARSETNAKTSETNAKASETAAKKSETDAAASATSAGTSQSEALTYRNEAERFRNEASQISGVDFATTAKAGLVKPDGTTTQTDAAGKLIVKDVAIGGNAGDLASARGQIGDGVFHQGEDADTFSNTGVYPCDNQTTNVPVIQGQGAGWIEAFRRGNLTSYLQRYSQLATGRIFSRRNPDGNIWQSWYEHLTGLSLGDGIHFTGGKISVPEYEGATASTPATSGLVPPAAAGEQGKVLSGAGTWVTPAAGGVVDTGNTMTLSGDVTGSGTFDAAGNASLVATVGDLSAKYQSVDDIIPDTFSASNIQAGAIEPTLTLSLNSPNLIEWKNSGACTLALNFSSIVSMRSKLVTLFMFSDIIMGATVTWPKYLHWVGSTNIPPIWGTKKNILVVNIWNIRMAQNGGWTHIASVVYNSEA